MSRRKRSVIIIGIVLSILIIVFAFLDINNIPSKNGAEFVRFDWAGILATMVVGLVTLFFTISVAEAQKKIESDKIASEKFFEVRFIEQYQRIVLEDDICLKLKIEELEKDILKSVKIDKDIVVHPIIDGKRKEDGQFLIKIDHDEHTAEHTDEGMDKDWLENDKSFCFVRIGILDSSCLDKFEKNCVYRIELQIVAKDMFGVEVKCKLCPWFRVVSKNANDISFSLSHSFGYYDSVKYIGDKTK